MVWCRKINCPFPKKALPGRVGQVEGDAALNVVPKPKVAKETHGGVQRGDRHHAQVQDTVRGAEHPLLPDAAL